MTSTDKPTTDEAQRTSPESRPDAPDSPSSLQSKVAGVASIVHGAGEVIRGYAIAATDFGRGSGKDIAATGKDEIGQGFSKLDLERKTTTTTTTCGTAAAPSVATSTQAAGYPNDEKTAPPAPRDASGWPDAGDEKGVRRDDGVAGQATESASSGRGIGTSTTNPDPSAAPRREESFIEIMKPGSRTDSSFFNSRNIVSGS
ncbi:hypothetical protein BGW80DRAFT_1306552 [Lactifluus volemus]|nr:hypothetical protein BGW80DRAFT_1306552 [Lactifluus volemus]